MKRALLWLITLILAAFAVGGWLTAFDLTAGDSGLELLVDFGIPILLTLGAIRSAKAARTAGPRGDRRPMGPG
ncbi:hypothetical protein [Peterkaempfera sp. SMS 1(5)a]|uniref:hypothetical protein n=1 Tax=Peterkaempfera podocarpi TaxID=3232308 RepID=UPI00366B6657